MEVDWGLDGFVMGFWNGVKPEEMGRGKGAALIWGYVT